MTDAFMNQFIASCTLSSSGLQIVHYFNTRPLAIVDEHPLVTALPRPSVVVALASAWVATAWTEVGCQDGAGRGPR